MFGHLYHKAVCHDSHGGVAGGGAGLSRRERSLVGDLFLLLGEGRHLGLETCEPCLFTFLLAFSFGFGVVDLSWWGVVGVAHGNKIIDVANFWDKKLHKLKSSAQRQGLRVVRVPNPRTIRGCRRPATKLRLDLVQGLFREGHELPARGQTIHAFEGHEHGACEIGGGAGLQGAGGGGVRGAHLRAQGQR
jgi:hypothetical protein